MGENVILWLSDLLRAVLETEYHHTYVVQSQHSPKAGDGRRVMEMTRWPFFIPAWNRERERMERFFLGRTFRTDTA